MLPKEHGAYGQLLFPIATALAIGHPGPGAALLSAAALCAFLGHEPLVYRDLSALENLELYGRLYRVAERRERSGMLLGRFGLWESRHERAGTFSRGMLQRLGLCRTFLHEPALLVLDEPYNALDDEGAALLDRELAERTAEHTFLVATHLA